MICHWCRTEEVVGYIQIENVYYVLCGFCSERLTHKFEFIDYE